MKEQLNIMEMVLKEQKNQKTKNEKIIKDLREKNKQKEH